MASTSETGHGKNVNHAQKRLEVLKGMGADYKPSNGAYVLTALEPKITEAVTAHKKVTDLAGPYKTAISNRQVAYKIMGTWTTKIKAAASSSEIDEPLQNNVYSLVKVINGQRIGDKPKAVEGKEAPKSNSVSRMSFVSRLENFTALAKLLGSIPGYAPNEDENKVATMLAYVTELETLNKTAFPLEENFGKAIAIRNKLLYTEKTGLVDVLEGVKKYVFSIGDKGKMAHKSLMGLTLRKYDLE